MKARLPLLFIVLFVLIPLLINTDTLSRSAESTRHNSDRTRMASGLSACAKDCGMPPSVTAPMAAAKDKEGSFGSKTEESTRNKTETTGNKAEESARNETEVVGNESEESTQNKTGSIGNKSEKSAQDKAEATSESEKAKKKTAYITIDDGPTRSITPQNLDTLKKYGVKATFFVLPKRKSDDLYRRILEEGHVIGNHSYSHNRRLVNGADEQFKEDVVQAKQFIYDKFGCTTTLFRFPGGSMGYGRSRLREKASVLAELGYRYFDWDVSTGDTNLRLFKNKSQDEIVSLFVNNVIKKTRGRKKLIVLMHDSAGKSSTAKALSKILEGLKEQGYTFDLLTNY